MEDRSTTIHTSFESLVPKESFSSVAEVMNYEKSGDAIENELAEYREYSKSKQKDIDEEVEGKIEEAKEEAEEFVGEDDSSDFDIDDLGVHEPYTDNEFGETLEEAEDVEPEELLEDFFSSAEFVIFVIELIIVWATNFYLKQNELDTIGIEEFKKTAREQKTLVKAWAKILRKHSVKIGAEFELLFAMGSTYGMKMKGIVERQKDRKELKMKNINKNVEKGVTIPPDNINEEKPKKKKVTKDNFRVNDEEEVLEEVVITKKDGGVINLLKDK